MTIGKQRDQPSTYVDTPGLLTMLKSILYTNYDILAEDQSHTWRAYIFDIEMAFCFTCFAHNFYVWNLLAFLHELLRLQEFVHV